MKPFALFALLLFFFVRRKIQIVSICFSIDNAFEWNEKLNNENYAHRPYSQRKKQIMNKKRMHQRIKLKKNTELN